MDAAPGTRIAEHSPQSYLAPTPARRVPVIFEVAISLLVPWSNSPRDDLPSFPGRTQMIRRLFADRAQFEAIRKWRAGSRTAPQWARDLLASHLENHARQCAETAAALRANEKGVR